MKPQYLKIGIIGVIAFSFLNNGMAQAFKHGNEEETVVDEGIFPSNPNFGQKKNLSKRSNGGASFDDNMTFEGNIPIDGGLSIFVTTLFAYGIKRLKKRNHPKRNV
jgi:hypothetical protein